MPAFFISFPFLVIFIAWCEWILITYAIKHVSRFTCRYPFHIARDILHRRDDIRGVSRFFHIVLSLHDDLAFRVARLGEGLLRFEVVEQVFQETQAKGRVGLDWIRLLQDREGYLARQVN